MLRASSSTLMFLALLHVSLTTLTMISSKHCCVRNGVPSRKHGELTSHRKFNWPCSWPLIMVILRPPSQTCSASWVYKVSPSTGEFSQDNTDHHSRGRRHQDRRVWPLFSLTLTISDQMCQRNQVLPYQGTHRPSSHFRHQNPCGAWNAHSLP